MLRPPIPLEHGGRASGCHGVDGFQVARVTEATIMGSAFGGEHHLGTRRVVEREPETHRNTLALDCRHRLREEQSLAREAAPRNRLKRRIN
jgi:hypothetical protein